MQHPTFGAKDMTSFGALDGHSFVQKNPRSHTGLDARWRNPLGRKPPPDLSRDPRIKCEVEGSSATCIQCMRRNVTCKFTSRKEKRDNLKRAHYVKCLEERLKRTESLLRAAGLLDEEAIGYDDFSTDDDEHDESDIEDDADYPSQDSSRSSGELRGESMDSAYASGSWDTADSQSRPLNSDKGRTKRCQPPINSYLPPCSPCSVIRVDSKEDSRYFGRCSSLSILSRDGIEWIKSKTGDATFLTPLFSSTNHDRPWDYWRPDVFHDVFSCKVFKPLPPRGEVFSLLRDYFRTVNRLFPLYHEASFMQLIEWQYTQQTCDDAARWAGINVILALAYEYRFSNGQKSEKDREKAWLYYKNSMSVFAELTMRRTDLLSVQALLGMALFLRGNSGTQSALPIVTAAIRSCQRMGLHRDIPQPHLSAVEQEQRKRVFWIAFILDQSSCIRVGNAPTQHPDDFDIGFPTETADDEFIMLNNHSFFQQLCHMTVIKSRIYSRLYATKALHNQSLEDIWETVKELQLELDEWKNVDAFHDEHLKQRGGSDDFLMGFACVGLQFVYYNALIMIHRLPVLIHFAYMRRLAGGARTSRDSRAIINQASTSTAICVQAARDTLKLVNNLPWGDVAWIWSLLYYIFLAVMTIFVNILRDSRHPNSKDDLQTLSMASTFFATLIPGDRPCAYARFMTRMCANFERIARMVIEREQKTIQLEKTQPAPAPAPEEPKMPSIPSTGVDIPQLEGLPPINSSGYVVLGSPEPIPATESASNTTSSSGADVPYRPIGNNINIIGNGLAPDLWQIPLTTDWELGNQFWGGLFGANCPGSEDLTMISQPSAMDMGFGYGEAFGSQWSYGPFFDPF
ncbi:hypothetical protein EYZ11_006080 [Aspergillus tanneri]|uniref:Xylanolytic transcriptional activator regulatory domain-containing protein n=1 Tax=Aspergillus tanneri TaxID=1220188 RepID=A0A4S3JGF3_9EURO|nr:hypothetical protein EYZ11_006080 [Aspergillus tanneri]